MLKQARQSLAQGDYTLAERLAVQIPETSEDWSAARTVAGEAATKAGRLPEALQYYLSVADSGDRGPHGSASPTETSAARFYSAEIHRELGQLSEAVRAYEAVLAAEPDNAATRERLAFVLSTTGQRWKSLPHYSFLARSGTATIEELVLLADLDRPVERREYLEECARKAPADTLVELGLASHTFWDGEAAEAGRRLRAVLSLAPELLAGQAMLGELLVDQQPRKLLEWHRDLPRAASSHPDIWYVRGLWARRQKDLRVAARCFWETLRLVPEHRRATYQLGQVLASLGDERAQDFGERADQLIRLTQLLDDVLRSESQRQDLFRETAELLERMGRIWEACAWGVAAERRFGDAQWIEDLFSRRSGMLEADLPLTIDSENLALRHDLSAFPDHAELFQRLSRERGRDPAAPSGSHVRFVEQALQSGVDFVYFNGPDASTPGVRMFESNGGGVAVGDFDADGRPDLYFTQGAEWPNNAEAPAPSEQYTDRIFRNVGESFVDVTAESGLGDQNFGQGCAAGDFNNDGFPDLYVANVGPNRVYRNNGDGTFSDITAQSGLVGDDWTASCAIVDLNADGNPDLFDVNYLEGEGLHKVICGRHACSPAVFGGAPDRLHVSRGDGTFEFIPSATPKQNAKGLGLVAIDLHGRGRPCLFIANDQVANFLLRNESAAGPHNIQLRDDAFLAGVAFNEDGLAMACMGIAADDADGNGLIDFFVTNFENEANTLYLQDAPGLFADATNPAGLRAPSWPFVGWGTQFLDADLDGWPDLVVTNGHVDDYRDEGRDYHMRPQFFRNQGGGRFVELMADEVGPWFAGEYLGRGLARLDWNSDGRMDFVVSNVGDPASLVTNESTGVGRFLNVRLQATTTARDAIGTVVEVAAGDRRWTKQLVAGDGYMASNERILQFGLGEVERVTELQVRWPSGGTTTLQNLPADATIQLVEGATRAIEWRGAESRLIDTQ